MPAKINSNLNVFIASMGLRKREVKNNDFVKNLVSNVGQRLVNETPVDTGQARSNWFISINQPSNEVDLGNTDGTLKGTENLKSSFNVLWLSNNLPYILRLNEGHSAQAPTGFIQKILQEEVADLRTKNVFKTF